MQRASASYTFGRFQLDAAERRFSRDGQAIPLTPKAFDTLLTLVQHSGHALSKDELMRAVWPDGFVEEVNLAYNISILRKALGAAGGESGERYIETVPKLGYRFVAPVREVQRESPPSARRNTNLPAQVTRFIGRERELAELSKAVTAKRLVTLTGAAGMGKTRLALEVARQMSDFRNALSGSKKSDIFDGGVWLAELAPLADEALVPATVAAALGVSEQPGRATTDVLTAHIADKHVLILLDNCEHVVADCARLADALLRACPNLHILATSREALRLPGESIWRVSPLSMPNSTEPLTKERVNDFDAMALFIEHATLSQPEFELNAHDLTTIAAICHQLDGMPLAIEMAAAQIPFMGLAGVAAQLKDRLSFLANGNRAAAPRQQTLRATLDWSYDLLTEPERALLARLSVFAGGWTRDDAESVCIDPDTSGLLDQLVRKSLVVFELHERHVRFRLLETIREYATGKLSEMSEGEKEALGRRYLAHYVQLAERAWPQADAEKIAWLNRLEFERGNCCAAIDWAVQRGDIEVAQHLAGGLGEFWRMRSHWREAREQLHKALAHSSPTERTSLRAKVLVYAGIVEWMHDEEARSLSLLEEALAIATELDDKENIVHALVRLGNLAWRQRDFAGERAYYLRALTVCRERGDLYAAPGLIELLADNYLETGQLDLAQRHYEETMRLRAELGEDSQLSLAWMSRGLGQIALARGEHEWARHLFAEGLKRIVETSYLWVIAVFISRFAGLAAVQGDMRRAARLFGAEDGLMVAEGATPSPVGDASEDRERALVHATLSDAEFEAAYAEGQRMTLDEAVAYALAGTD